MLLVVVVAVQAIKNAGLCEVMTEEDLDSMMDTADTSGNGTIEYSGTRPHFTATTTPTLLPNFQVQDSSQVAFNE